MAGPLVAEAPYGLIDKENPLIGKGEVFSLAGKRVISNQGEESNEKTELENIGPLADVTSISTPQDILGDNISENGKCISDPLRLTGGGDASFEGEEYTNVECQGNGLISSPSTPPVENVSECGMFPPSQAVPHLSMRICGPGYHCDKKNRGLRFIFHLTPRLLDINSLIT